MVGLARSGTAAALALAEAGQVVKAVDSGRPDGLEPLDAAGIEYLLEDDGIGLLDGVGTVVKSPGVPADAPVVLAARERGITVLGELEIGWRMIPSRFLAITGTNGKTTATELTTHLFRSAGRPVVALGNVGNPVCGLAAERPSEGLTVVCECSSFQLEDTQYFSPDCAVFLNLAPDHLDRHGDMDSYGQAKLRIFANQEEGDVAVLNEGDDWLAGVDIPGAAQRTRYVATDRGDRQVDLWIEEGRITVEGRPLIEVSRLPLPGRHNVANAMAAAAAGLSFGLDEEAVSRGLESFQGLPHRMEPVAEVDGVSWVNDSKGTNVSATGAALASFDADVRLILGGSLKGESFGPLEPAILRSCTSVHLIGEAMPELRSALADVEAGGVPLFDCGDLPTAVGQVAAMANAGDVVLLSPACASFDQFGDYEERGELFRELVRGLAEDA